MGFDEKFFGWIYKSKKSRERLKLQRFLKENHAFSVAEHEKELCVFASALWGRAIEVRPMLGAGDFDEKTLFLPEYFCVSNSAEVNRKSALLRILHESSWKYSKENREALSRLLSQKYPNYLELLSLLKKSLQYDDSCIWPLPRSRDLLGLKVNNGIMPTANNEESEEKKSLELKALPKSRVKKLEQLKSDNIGDQVFHCFEKIETIEEYKGVDRQAEPEDSLDEKSSALEELHLEAIIRSNERTTQNYAVDMIGGFEVIAEEESSQSLKVHEKRFHYDEWDYSRRSYKKDWCVVIEREATISNSPFQLQVVDESKFQKLKKEYQKLRNQRKTQKKLYSGTSIDIDQVVRNFSLFKVSGNLDERVYKRELLRYRDLATYVLLDTSLSSDSWVNGKRVLDESLDALALLSKLLKEFNDPIAVSSFYSNTRLECHFDLLKDFGESWQDYNLKVSSIKPQGYTRIGPAIRHATEKLAQRKESKKLLLLISDAKPTDFDRYEGTYGIADTARSVLEASSRGVLVHTFTFEESKKSLLPRMFGSSNYSVLADSSDLSFSFAKIIQRLSKSKLN